MTRKSILLAALCLTSAALLASRAQAAGELAGIPKDADIVGYLNVADIRSDPDFEANFEKILSQADKESLEEYERFKKETGVDVARDLNSLAVGVFLPESDSDADPEFVVTMRGQFVEAKIMAAVDKYAAEEQQTIERAEHKGKALYSTTPKGEEDATYWSFPAPGMVVLSNGAALAKQAMDSAMSGASAEADPDLKGLLGKTKQSATFWAVGALPKSGAAAPQPGGGAAQMKDAIESFTFSLDRGAGLALNAAINCRDAQTPLQMKQNIQAGLGMAMMMQMQLQLTQEELALFNTALQRIQSKVDGKTLTVDFSLDQDEYKRVKALVEKVQTQLNQQMGQGGPGGMGGPGMGPGMAPPPTRR